MRILITGSRDWDLMESISARISEAIIAWVADRPHLKSGPVDWVHIIHGDCPKGADFLADQFARNVLNFTDENIHKYPADWSMHGRSAGHKRNARMVNLMPDVCLAFIRDSSPGSTGCARLASKAGIPTEIFRYENEIEKYGF